MTELIQQLMALFQIVLVALFLLTVIAMIRGIIQGIAKPVAELIENFIWFLIKKFRSFIPWIKRITVGGATIVKVFIIFLHKKIEKNKREIQKIREKLEKTENTKTLPRTED